LPTRAFVCERDKTLGANPALLAQLLQKGAGFQIGELHKPGHPEGRVALQSELFLLLRVQHG
jgi:hypothetical protein